MRFYGVGFDLAHLLRNVLSKHPMLNVADMLNVETINAPMNKLLYFGLVRFVCAKAENFGVVVMIEGSSFTDSFHLQLTLTNTESFHVLEKNMNLSRKTTF